MVASAFPKPPTPLRSTPAAPPPRGRGTARLCKPLHRLPFRSQAHQGPSPSEARLLRLILGLTVSPACADPCRPPEAALHLRSRTRDCCRTCLLPHASAVAHSWHRCAQGGWFIARVGSHMHKHCTCMMMKEDADLRSDGLPSATWQPFPQPRGSPFPATGTPTRATW